MHKRRRLMKSDGGLDTCEHCGARLSGRWERVTPGLVAMLVKFKRAVLAKNENRIHVWKEAALTNNETHNFQKLRFHALVAKVRDSDGKHEIGYWLLTRRGNRFLKGLEAIPRRVFVFRNEVKDHDAGFVDIADVMGSRELPYFETRDTLEYQIDGESVGALRKDLFLNPA